MDSDQCGRFRSNVWCLTVYGKRQNSQLPYDFRESVILVLATMMWWFAELFAAFDIQKSENVDLRQYFPSSFCHNYLSAIVAAAAAGDHTERSWLDEKWMQYTTALRTWANRPTYNDDDDDDDSNNNNNDNIYYYTAPVTSTIEVYYNETPYFPLCFCSPLLPL